MIIACPNGCGEKIPKKDVSLCNHAGVVLLILIRVCELDYYKNVVGDNKQENGYWK